MNFTKLCQVTRFSHLRHYGIKKKTVFIFETKTFRRKPIILKVSWIIFTGILLSVSVPTISKWILFRLLDHLLVFGFIKRFFYENVLYKNVEAEICRKNKNVLRMF